MITTKDLTIEEKLRMLCGDGAWHISNANGKLPHVSMSDGPVGIRKEKPQDKNVDYSWTHEAYPSVCYPSICLLANTWDKATAYKMGSALGDDCLECDVDILLAPGVNIKRNPLNGRNFEYFSEDPYLAGTLAKEYINGVQDKGVGVCLKHFCCNNLEVNRHEQTSEVDERTLREIYYKPFEIACEADPLSIMSSYNRINGVKGSEYKKGYDALRNDMGFKGAIFSDWNAVYNRAKACKAGCDLEMPFDADNYAQLLKDYEAGKLTEAEIDACVERLINLVYRVTDMRKGKKSATDIDQRAIIAEEIAAEGMVLLKNDGVLPIKKGQKVAVCGQSSAPQPGMISGGGSARVNWRKNDFDLGKLLSQRLGDDIPSIIGFEFNNFEWRGGFRTVMKKASDADVSIVCAYTGENIEHENDDRTYIRLPEQQEKAILDLARANENTVVVLFAGSSVDTTAWEDKVAAIIYAGFCGEGGGRALADILVGKVNPSGKLSETFAVLEDIPAVNCYDDSAVTVYEEGLNVGYRYFDTFDKPVIYPFGYGLSYSEFEYSNLKIEYGNGLDLTVKYTIENISDIDGKEVSQVYVGEQYPFVYRPSKELKGFSKDLIKAGKKKEIEIKLDRSSFAYYSTATDKWEVSDGIFEICVGSSVEDIHLIVKVEIKDGEFVK